MSESSTRQPEELTALKRAIHALEAQRAVLGDALINAALAPLLERQSILEGAAAEVLRSGERRVVTVVFADVVGFSALAQAQDAEALRDLVISVFERLAPVVKKYGGIIEKFAGDAILAIFGAPTAHENDPERALHCAIEMMMELRRYNEEHGLQLGLHCGVNTGPVVAGSLGSHADAEYGVLGDAVNIAARLMEAAPGGQILVGRATYHCTAPLYLFDEPQSIQVKGRSELLSAYRLLGAKPRRLDLRDTETPATRSNLVGRDKEMAVLRRCLWRVVRGDGGGVLFVLGEAGLGKSRLMAELRKEVPADELRWLEGRTLSISQSLSYWPFQEFVRQYAGITEEDSEASAWDKLQECIFALFPDQPGEILPYLASLLALTVREPFVERVKYLDGEGLRRQLFLAVYRFVERLARAGPVVLVFEDLHWADPSSVALIEHLLSLVTRVPLLLCIVSRSDSTSPALHLAEVAARDYRGAFQQIRLEPLSPVASAELVQSLLKLDTLPAELRNAIQSKAEGNPFFIEEVVRSLVEIGAVVQEPETGQWRMAAPVETLIIPDTIQGVVMARVDRLDEEVKQVLRMASVIGRSFLYRLLGALDEADQELDRSLEVLRTLELIRLKTQKPELAYIFKHALTQEATYESILLRQRKEWHARVGQCLETLYAGRLEGFYSLLAYHYARAEEWAKAQEYLFKAGDQASNMAADAEALTCYRQAMQAYERTFGDQWDPVQRAVLERRMGEALFHRGEAEAAMECFQRALRFLGVALPDSRGALLRSAGRELLRQVGHRLLPGLFLKPFGPVTPALEERVRTLERLGSMDALNNPERFVWEVLQFLNDSESGGHLYGVAVGLAAVGTVFDLVPLPWVAEQYHRRALSLAEQSQHPNAIARTSSLMSIHEIMLARLDSAATYGLRAADIYRRTGSLWDWYLALTQSTIPAMGFSGKLGQVPALCQALMRMGQETGDLQAQEMGTGLLGSCYRYMGRTDDAVATGLKAIELDAVIHDAYLGSIFHAELGRSYLARLEFEPALQMVEEGQRILLTHTLRGASAGMVYNALAEVYLWAAEHRPATEKERWMDLARGALRGARQQGRLIHAGEAEAIRFQGTYEWLRGKRSAATRHWQRSAALAEKRGQLIELRWVNLEMGQRLKNPQLLQRAAELWEEIVPASAKPVVAKT